MPHGYLRAAVPLIGLTANVLSQICLARYCKKIGLVKSVILGLAVGFTVGLACEVYLRARACASFDESLASFMTHSLSYICLGYCYFHFLNLGETARRIRILRELKDAGNGLSLQDILRRYNAKQIIQMRLDRLIKNKQIILKDTRFYIGNPTLLFAAEILVGLKKMLLGREKGNLGKECL